ncbi:hypothetical protein [Pseudomonas sp.]|uniref:hypothetical protein n=1 Tax=Pseudomonas sp. TaxID=306 RepID=UPI0019DBFA8E|nr:hypothetical protein [Pseudomonas sp.]MBF0675557.1 hypothetical protein [Pseudomonas sp.]
MNKYLYAPHDWPFEEAYEIECRWDHEEDGEWIAEEAAADYHSEHDGWEARWPLKLMLWLPDGTEIGAFTVEREYEPVFSASKEDAA